MVGYVINTLPSRLICPQNGAFLVSLLYLESAKGFIYHLSGSVQARKIVYVSSLDKIVSPITIFHSANNLASQWICTLKILRLTSTLAWLSFNPTDAEGLSSQSSDTYFQALYRLLLDMAPERSPN